jgi:hypothetical protein
VVNRVAVSTTVSPVTHTALVEVKKASVKLMGEYVESGIINKKAPPIIMNPKLTINNCAGLKIRTIKSSLILDISRIKRKNAKK